MRVVLSLASVLPSCLSENTLREVVKATCLAAFPTVFQKRGKGVRLEVAIVDDREIQELNRTYRGKDKPTDVLSFGDFESRQSVKLAPSATLDLGTIILSHPFIDRSAKEDGVSWEREFMYVFSHGVLHLLGFDHEEEMFTLQDRITDQFAPLGKNKRHDST